MEFKLNNLIYSNSKNKYQKLFLKKNNYLISYLENLRLNSINSKNLKKFKSLKKRKELVADYIISICFTKYNIRVHISNNQGNVIKTFTSGTVGFKKSQRKKVFSHRSVALEALDFLRNIKDIKNSNLFIRLKGFNKNRMSILRIFSKSNLRYNFKSIVDISSIPFNGCRSKRLPRK